MSPVHSTLSVVVNGGLEEEPTFTDYALEAAFLAELEREAADHGYPVEVFRVEHGDHSIGDECECVQFSQDHRPVVSFNV